jgi:hypothetical protein
MANVEIKGITKVNLQNPTREMANIFTRIPDQFNRKRNPTNGRKLITNIPTQLLGNRAITGVIVWESGDSEIQVELTDFAPARNLETQTYDKGESGKFYKDYRYGGIDNDRIATREFLATLSYFAVCVLTGMLPTPTKRSGQSTIMSQFIQEMSDVANLEIKEVRIVGGNGAEMIYTSDQFNQTLSLFNANANDILNNWDDSKRASANDGGIDWV